MVHGTFCRYVDVTFVGHVTYFHYVHISFDFIRVDIDRMSRYISTFQTLCEYKSILNALLFRCPGWDWLSLCLEVKV